jgi:hypothetical protein
LNELSAFLSRTGGIQVVHLVRQSSSRWFPTMVAARVGARIWCSALSAQLSTPPQSKFHFRYSSVRLVPSSITALRSFRSSTARPSDPTSRPSSDFQVAATDVQHAEFVAQAKAKSTFEVSDRDKQGSSRGKLPKDEGVSRDGKGSDAERAQGSGGGPTGTANSTDSKTGTYVGKLSPTSSHLFKLIIPLPPSLQAAIGTQTNDHSTVPSPKMIDTAFLLHPSQPLSHVSRLILGSLPAAERDAEVEFRAVSGREHNAYPSLVNTTSGEQAPENEQFQADQATDDEGGPLLYERNPDGGELQEVRWSTSTDLGDFIKQATLAQHFRVVLKPSWETIKGHSTSADTANRQPAAREPKVETQEPQEPELSLKIMIPTFDSRTKFLRKRLLYLTREIAVITDKKKQWVQVRAIENRFAGLHFERQHVLASTSDLIKRLIVERNESRLVVLWVW